MQIFCVKCKRKTATSDIYEAVSKNGRKMVKGTCDVCGTKKNQFVKGKALKVSGSGLSDYLPDLNNLDNSDMAFIIQFLALKIKELATEVGSTPNKILHDVAKSMDDYLNRMEEKEIKKMGFKLEGKGMCVKCQTGGSILDSLKKKFKNLSKKDLAIMTLTLLPIIAQGFKQVKDKRAFDFNNKVLGTDQTLQLMGRDTVPFLSRNQPYLPDPDLL